jgi:tetratricopeptide (TPR) repeat protein
MLGDTPLAKKSLEGLLDIDPLSHFALFEAYLLQPGSGTLDAFNLSFKNEMAREEYIETALFYEGLGLIEEAVKVLEEAPAYPVIDYWLAWLNRDDKEKSNSYLERAQKASPDYVFPYRNKTLPVLKWASEQSPNWVTDYYSALILWNNGMEQEALDLLELWENTPDFIPFYYSRAHLSGIQSEQALKDMQRALELDPGQWRVYRDLAEIYFKAGDNEAAMQLAEEGYERFPGNYILELAFSKYLTVSGDYQKSLDVLEKTRVLPFEGENTGQRLHIYNHLLLAYEQFQKGEYELAINHIDQSELYPENLGSGAPYAPDLRDQNTLRKMIYDKTGQRELAREAEQAIVDYDTMYGKRRGRSLFDQQFSTMVIQPF